MGLCEIYRLSDKNFADSEAAKQNQFHHGLADKITAAVHESGLLLHFL